MTRAPGLAAATARGFFWMTVMNLTGKVVGFLGQIALARVLLPDHFGLISLAFTISTFADLMQSTGLREVLVRRRAKLQIWSGPAIWLSLAIGLVAAIGLALAAPIAAIAYGKGPVVAHLILILAITAPINALAIVPEARLQQELRFRAIAIMSFLQSAGYLIIALVLALLGLEAYSFAIAILFVSIAKTVVLWHLTKPKIPGRPRFRRSLHLVRETSILIASAAVINIMSQGDKFALGIFHAEADVGAYFFAYNLSIQTVAILALNLSRVLFAVLSKMQDEPERQRNAYVRASRTLISIGAPLCFMQAAGAAPFVRLFLQNDKWAEAIDPLRILSLLMVLHLGWNSSRSLIQVQGRYTFYLKTAAVYASIYLLCVVSASAFGSIVSVAIAAGGVLGCMSVVDVMLALRPLGGSWRDLSRIFTPGIVLGAIAVAPAFAIDFLVPELRTIAGLPLREILLIIAIPIVMATIYIPLIRFYAPDVWHEIAHRVGPKFARLPLLARFAARFRVGTNLPPGAG